MYFSNSMEYKWSFILGTNYPPPHTRHPLHLAITSLTFSSHGPVDMSLLLLIMLPPRHLRHRTPHHTQPHAHLSHLRNPMFIVFILCLYLSSLPRFPAVDFVVCVVHRAPAHSVPVTCFVRERTGRLHIELCIVRRVLICLRSRVHAQSQYHSAL